MKKLLIVLAFVSSISLPESFASTITPDFLLKPMPVKNLDFIRVRYFVNESLEASKLVDKRLLRKVSIKLVNDPDGATLSVEHIKNSKGRLKYAKVRYDPKGIDALKFSTLSFLLACLHEVGHVVIERPITKYSEELEADWYAALSFWKVFGKDQQLVAETANEILSRYPWLRNNDICEEINYNKCIISIYVAFDASQVELNSDGHWKTAMAPLVAGDLSKASLFNQHEIWFWSPGGYHTSQINRLQTFLKGMLCEEIDIPCELPSFER